MPCPSELELRAFLQGELDHLSSSLLAEHLKHCPPCQRMSERMDTAVDAGPADQSTPPMRTQTRVMGPVTPISTPGQPAAAAPAHHFPFLLPPVQPDEIGRLGNYRVLGLLGKGGMAYVFRAEDIALRRPVALKVMKPELGQDGEGWQRFLREARIMAAVKHDHLVTVYQVGQEGSTVYLAMELLQGESLGERMDRQPTADLPEILRLGREIAAGLAVVHGHDMVHRDVKPDNIWLEAPHDRVKILDFGLARLATSDIRLTQTGTIMGTPSFMAPEQARGLPVDARCDLFSLGCILYTLCSGEKPFQAADTMGMLTALAVDTPRAVEELNPALPPALAVLVMQLLAKDPALRPASAQEVIDRLQAIERGPLPIAPALPARPTARLAARRQDDTPIMPPPQRPDARRWRWLALAGVLLLGSGLAWLGLSGGAAKPKDKEIARTETKASATTPATPVVKKKPPVKVFLLAGQTDMSGRGHIRTIDWLGQDPKHAGLLKKIKGADGNWIVRPDVWVYHSRDKGTKSGPLSVGFGDSDNEIGPELLFGHLMGDHYDNQVLIIKVTQGPMSLAVEGRPPSAPGAAGGGPFYRRMIQTCRDVLEVLDIHFPGYQGQGYELAGFIWFQAWNDMIDAGRRTEYANNLINLIKDVRRDLNAPNLPVVIGELGVNGEQAVGPIVDIRNIQAGVARRGEFKGTVALGKTAHCWDNEADALVKKGFIQGKWKDKELQDQFDKMGSQIEFLYLGSGKIYALIGQSFAEAMKPLLR